MQCSPCAALAVPLLGSAFLLSGCGSSSPDDRCDSGESIAEYGDRVCFSNAPFCAGSASDCYAHSMTFEKSDSDCHGTEHSCATGTKANCLPINSCCPGYGYVHDTLEAYSNGPSCDLCTAGTYSTGGLDGCLSCADCGDDTMIRVGCSGSNPGTCKSRNCVHYQQQTSCPSGASQPCVFTITHSSSTTHGSSITVGGAVTVSPAEMVNIQAQLSHTSFVETTVTDTQQSVIAMKPGSSSCVFQRATLQPDGYSECNQPEISGNMDNQDQGKVCKIDESNPAFNDQVCTSHDVCGDGAVGPAPKDASRGNVTAKKGWTALV